MTRLGFCIPNFNYPGVARDGLFAAIAAQAREAEAAGFDTVMVMDHFYQLPGIGPADRYMLECYTLLSGLAAETATVRLGALVTGNTYRNPAVLAKTVTTLDIVSGGRAQLGIGAGWFQLEHDAFGIEFGTFTDRFEKLDEALQIIVPMLRGESVTLDGSRYRTVEAFNEPAPISRIPILIGGSGERKTLRMVAQYADAGNIGAELDELPRKMAALGEHCERLGRDRREIVVSFQRGVCIAPTREQAQAEFDAWLAASEIGSDQRASVSRRTLVGGPDDVAEQLQQALDAGLDGFTVNAIANGHIPGRIALLGETAGALLR